MSGTLKLEIITPVAPPTRPTWQMVTLPRDRGQIGIYPMHVRC
jgi:F0F1-type ATP synthase epsilon subunit